MRMWEDKKLVRERKGGRPRQREPCVKAQIIESDQNAVEEAGKGREV